MLFLYLPYQHLHLQMLFFFLLHREFEILPEIFFYLFSVLHRKLIYDYPYN